MRIHLDTDFGGDPDDACALAMLLGWPEVEIVGITTSIDPGGIRAGAVRYVLGLVDRDDILVAAGAEATLTSSRRYDPTCGDRRHWPEPVQAAPAPAGAATCYSAASNAVRRSSRSGRTRTSRCSRSRAVGASRTRTSW